MNKDVEWLDIIWNGELVQINSKGKIRMKRSKKLKRKLETRQREYDQMMQSKGDHKGYKRPGSNK